MLLGKARMVTALKEAAKKSPADSSLIAAERSSRTTLRFSGGRIHQNFHEEDVTAWVKVACDGQMGIASTCSLSAESLKRAVASAMTIAKIHAKRMPPAFSAAPSKMATPSVNTYFPETTRQPLSQTIEMIRDLWRKGSRLKTDLAGSFVVGEDELCVVGSEGLSQYQPFSMTGLRLVASRGAGSGFAAQATRNARELDAQRLFERACRFCGMNKNPKTIPLGKYDVLLEPEAVAELLEWMSYIGFGAKHLIEGTSFMSGKMGSRLMQSSVSIVDDASNEEGLAVPFDYEGVPKQKVTLISKGIAEGVVYDSHYAKMHRRASTGHALSFDEFEGPIASNLFFSAGVTPYSQLRLKMERGLWICRFHYVNGLLKTQEALMTGLTRDGTFFVEKGRVTGAVKNLRFTQSILESFSKIAAASRERWLVADPSQGFASQVVPALLIKDFNFTGQTQ